MCRGRGDYAWGSPRSQLTPNYYHLLPIAYRLRLQMHEAVASGDTPALERYLTAAPYLALDRDGTSWSE